MSCRKIDGVLYIDGDITHKCYEDDHLYFVILLIGPATIFWSLLTPFYFLINLFRNKNKL